MNDLFILFLIMTGFFISTRIITYLILKEVEPSVKHCSYHDWEWVEGKGHVCKVCKITANYIGRE